jgi:hypothetical protein
MPAATRARPDYRHELAASHVDIAIHSLRRAATEIQEFTLADSVMDLIRDAEYLTRRLTQAADLHAKGGGQ